METSTLLSPLFNVDFDDLLQKDGFVSLDSLELGSFASAEVMKGEDYDTIRFISPMPLITKELDDFIAVCTALLGTDIAGRGIITDADHLMADINCFSRIWKGLTIKSHRDEDIEIDEIIIDITINHS